MSFMNQQQNNSSNNYYSKYNFQIQRHSQGLIATAYNIQRSKGYPNIYNNDKNNTIKLTGAWPNSISNSINNSQLSVRKDIDRNKNMLETISFLNKTSSTTPINRSKKHEKLVLVKPNSSKNLEKKVQPKISLSENSNKFKFSSKETEQNYFRFETHRKIHIDKIKKAKFSEKTKQNNCKGLSSSINFSGKIDRSKKDSVIVTACSSKLSGKIEKKKYIMGNSDISKIIVNTCPSKKSIVVKTVSSINKTFERDIFSGNFKNQDRPPLITEGNGDAILTRLLLLSNELKSMIRQANQCNTVAGKNAFKMNEGKIVEDQNDTGNLSLTQNKAINNAITVCQIENNSGKLIQKKRRRVNARRRKRAGKKQNRSWRRVRAKLNKYILNGTLENGSCEMFSLRSNIECPERLFELNIEPIDSYKNNKENSLDNLKCVEMNKLADEDYLTNVEEGIFHPCGSTFYWGDWKETFLIKCSVDRTIRNFSVINKATSNSDALEENSSSLMINNMSTLLCGTNLYEDNNGS